MTDGTARAAVDWNPAQYAKYRDERAQPFFDLLALVQPQPDMRVVDLGCGPGELTSELHRALGARETVGIDNSPAMLEKAAAYAGAGLRFAAGDLGTFCDSGAFDLIFSNAALQWSPDHPALLARLTASLAPGGQLAVQVPANDDAPSHALAAVVASESPFREALGGFTRQSPVLPPAAYAALLYQLGYQQQTVRLQVYGHLLPGREDVIEWVRGTWLTAYEKRLPAELWPAFLERYREALFAQTPDDRPFFYPFKRILFWGRR
ncbi:MAG: methyltransferase domain-containing protein [Thermomicrobiales bacterium]|nr:methyltransferase domain-containing protein [Thermomicrobiales bacterium]